MINRRGLLVKDKTNFILQCVSLHSQPTIDWITIDGAGTGLANPLARCTTQPRFVTNLLAVATSDLRFRKNRVNTTYLPKPLTVLSVAVITPLPEAMAMPHLVVEKAEPRKSICQS